MNDSPGGGGRGAAAATTISLPQISRRDLLARTLAGASVVVTGMPVQVAAAAARASTGRLAREGRVRGPLNVQVSHEGIPGRGHSEPSLAVNPRNPRNLLVACSWGPNAYVSFDGGLTWRGGGALTLPPQSGGGNMSAAFDSAGRGFVCGSFGSPGATRVLVWRTEDGGRTFTEPVVAGQAANLDRPWLAADRGAAREVHVVWSQGSAAGSTTDVRYTRSTDAARTFDAARSIVREAAGLGNPMVTCGAPGSIYIIYSAGRGAVGRAGPDSPSTVTVVCSHDQGKTFEAPIALGPSTDFLAFPSLRGGTGSSLPAIAADPDTALVCAAFVDHTAGASSAGVVLAGSRDAGRTWSRATALAPLQGVIYFQPEVAIDDAGRIGVMAFAIKEGMVSVVLAISNPGSLRFGSPITISAQPFDASKVEYKLGDYQALATTPGAFHPLWNDTRTGELELFTAAVPVTR